MAIATPSTWRDLRQVNVDLGDVLGSPGVDHKAATKAASGAFATRARDVSHAGNLFLVAERAVGNVPRQKRPVQTSVGAFASIAPKAVPDRDDFRKVRALQSSTGAHVSIQQRVRGHDIVGARYSVHEDDQGTYAVTGHAAGDVGALDPGSPPPKDPAAARRALRKLFDVEGGRRVPVWPVVFPVDGAGRWAWYAHVPLAKPRVDLRVYLDASDLSVMLSYPSSVPALFGEARVFPVNPLRTPAVVPVALRNLGPMPTDCLTGAIVDVRTGASNTVWSRPLRDFIAEPSDATFDEVAVYVHLSAAIQYFLSLVRPDTFGSSIFKPMRVVVHDDASMDNAFFHPDRGVLTFGDFDGGARSSARSADIVFHEFGHAVSHAICGLSSTPAAQARGLSEGYSDYFASSALGDSRFGDYVMDVPEGARDCAKPDLHADQDLDDMEEHNLGEVWAAVLWAIREQVGPSIADAIAVESLYFGQGMHAMPEARQALHAADRAMFPLDDQHGRHEDVIDEAYQKRFG